MEVHGGELPHIVGVDLVRSAEEGLPAENDVHGGGRVEGVPEDVLFPVPARRLEGEACDLASVPPDAAAAPVDHAKP